MTATKLAGPPPSAERAYAESFQNGYVELLDRILNGPVLNNAPRGNPSREILCVDLVLADPRNRLITLPARKANLAFQFAELLWYLARSDDLAMPEYYAPSIRKYSADGRTLSGTAYGPRIFAWPGGHEQDGIDQWAMVSELLRRDPDTKRAVLAIYNPAELASPDNPDVACTLALHFLCRDGLLHCVTTMRANDAYRGIVSDVFSFTMLHELMAVQLGLGLGTYHHRVNSLHLYAPDHDRAVSVISAWRASGSPAAQAMQALPRVPLESWLPHVLTAEREMRLTGRSLPVGRILDIPVPRFWLRVVSVLGEFADWKAGRPACDDLRAVQPPSWRAMQRSLFGDGLNGISVRRSPGG
jgi:thymidylate synthase